MYISISLEKVTIQRNWLQFLASLDVYPWSTLVRISFDMKPKEFFNRQQTIKYPSNWAFSQDTAFVLKWYCWLVHPTSEGAVKMLGNVYLVHIWFSLSTSENDLTKTFCMNLDKNTISDMTTELFASLNPTTLQNIWMQLSLSHTGWQLSCRARSSMVLTVYWFSSKTLRILLWEFIEVRAVISDELGWFSPLHKLSLLSGF